MAVPLSRSQTQTTGSDVADALEAIAVAARAWGLRFGPGDPWRIACVLSGGVLLATRASAYSWAT